MTRLPGLAHGRRRHAAETGFSLVELIVVLVLIGILATLALPRLDSGSFEDVRFRDGVLSGLRYAQKSAIAARRTVCASFAQNPSQASFLIAAQGAANCAAGTPLAGPDGGVLVVTARGAAAFAALPADVVFDAGGRPLTGAAAITIGTLAISVEAETGYVH